MKKKISIIIPFLAIILPLVIISFVGLIIWFNTSMENEILESQTHYGETVTSEIARSLKTVINNQITLANLLASRTELIDYCSDPGSSRLHYATSKTLKDLASEFDYYEDIVLLSFGQGSIELDIEGEIKRIPDGGVLISTASNNVLGTGTDKDWSCKIKSGHSYCISDAYLSLTSNSPVFMVTVPVKKDGKLIGAVGLVPKLNYLTDEFFTASHFNNEEYVFMLNSNGDVISHPDKDIMFTELGRETIAPHLEKISNGELAYIASFNGIESIYYFGHPLDLGENSSSIWYVYYRVPVSTMLLAAATFSRLSTIIVIIVIILITLLIIIVTRAMVLSPLKVVKNELDEIAKGGGDLTEKVEITTRNEIGEIADSFNTFTETLRNMMNRIKDSVTVNRELRDKLGASTEETSAAVNQIMSNINSIKNMINKLSGQSEEAGESTNRINKNVQLLNEQADSQSSAVQQSNAAVEEMIASLRNMADITSQHKSTSDKLAESADISSSKLSETYEAISRVNTNIDSIIEMTEVIDNISNQTNLLAMNAAIEAAHAGEAGKGFAVVADEIRKLAEDSSASSSKIAVEVRTIVEQIKNSTANTGSLQETMADMVKDIRKTALAFSEINSSTQEMSSGSEQVLMAMSSLSDMAVQLSNASAEMQDGTIVVSENISSVLELTQSTNAAIEEISSGSNEILSAIEEMRENVGELGDKTKELSDDVESFKT